jgi:redox-sensitive bicupin YhaK (pirin superfamily)
MSFFPGPDPVAGDPQCCDAVDLVIVPRTVDLDGFTVRRALPHAKRRMVGPFVFFDHMGPSEFKVGKGIDVRPHPHIGLATVTFLYDGEIMHRDSLGSELPIRPGELNWMSAGRGIVHSERTAPEHRAVGEKLHGLQLWVALPAADEESEPWFAHHGAEDLPTIEGDGKRVRLVAGSLFGARSPVKTNWDTLFADVALEHGATMPIDAGYEERAVYVVKGEIDLQGDRFGEGKLLVIKPGDVLKLTAVQPSQIVIVGGAAMDGPRHIWWNFVSSRKERIEQAKADWKQGRFDTVPSDATEFIPLPD